jgi:hypothetical protein
MARNSIRDQSHGRQMGSSVASSLLSQALSESRLAQRVSLRASGSAAPSRNSWASQDMAGVGGRPVSSRQSTLRPTSGSLRSACEFIAAPQALRQSLVWSGDRAGSSDEEDEPIPRREIGKVPWERADDDASAASRRATFSVSRW